MVTLFSLIKHRRIKSFHIDARASKFLCKPFHELLRYYLSPQIESIREIISMACESFHLENVSFAHSQPLSAPPPPTFRAHSTYCQWYSPRTYWMQILLFIPSITLFISQSLLWQSLSYKTNQLPFPLGPQTIFPSLPCAWLKPSSCILANGMCL